MTNWKTFFIVAAMAAAGLSLGALAAEDGAAEPEQTAPTETAAAPKCRKAAVNPVTGHAVCVDPRGAPVAPPPAEALNKPCKQRDHDDDPFTVYERYSACD